jgi:hypothetical protein
MMMPVDAMSPQRYQSDTEEYSMLSFANQPHDNQPQSDLNLHHDTGSDRQIPGNELLAPRYY